MQRELAYIFIYCCISNSCFGQTPGCDDCDSSYHKSAPFVKKDYHQYKTDSCDLKRFNDNKTAKIMYCQARYYSSIKDYSKAIELLLQAYYRGSSTKLKFQILKSIVYTSKLSGDTKRAAIYQEKVDKVLLKFPDIEK